MLDRTLKQYRIWPCRTWWDRKLWSGHENREGIKRYFIVVRQRKMDAYKTVGYKTGLVRMLFILISIIFIICVNFFFFSFSFVWLLFFVVTWLLWWYFMRILTRVYYSFEQDDIVIHMPNKKSFTLKKGDIVSLRPLEDIWAARFRGIWVFWWNHEAGHEGDNKKDSMVFCITSHEHLVVIEMSDGKYFVISPRRIDNSLYDYYV